MAISENQYKEQLPPGGNTGQILMKNSGADFDVKWAAGKPVLLWENSSPTSNFSGQEIQIEALKNFDFVLIFYRPFYAIWSGIYLNEPLSTIIKKGKSVLCSFVNTFDFRNVEVKDDRIVFGDGKSTSNYGANLNSKDDNRKCVPLAIYGLM